MNNFASKLAMMTSYHRNRFLLITHVDRKPGSANRLVPLSTVYSERFWR